MTQLLDETGSVVMDLQIPGAARITKGSLPLRVLSEHDVQEHLDPLALLSGLADGFRSLARGEIQEPPRPGLTLPLGFILSMPAYAEGLLPTVKMVSVFEANLQRELPNHIALIVMFDPDTGAPVCVMDGTFITGIRTAGAAVVSADVLARRDSRVATIIGAGVQGRHHLALLPLVRELDEIRIASRHHEDAEFLASLDPRAVAVTDVEQAVSDSDIVCLATHSKEPVIEAAWVRPGTHVSSVGYYPPRGELPLELRDAGLLVIEDAAALEEPPVGCAELRGVDAATCLGDILVGAAAGRTSADQVTVYKAMGVAMEDMVAANLAYASALASDAGVLNSY